VLGLLVYLVGAAAPPDGKTPPSAGPSSVAASIADTVPVPVTASAPGTTPADPTRAWSRWTPTAASFAGLPTVGALFRAGVRGGHGCSGGVVASPGRDLVITAAHCISGTGQGVVFAPGFHDGQAPYGTWPVTAAFADPGWVTSQDPRRDFVFLRVAPHLVDGRLQQIGDLVGGDRIGLAPRPGELIRPIAYPNGSDDPISCTAGTHYARGFPAFDCHGYVGGTSGGPWLTPAGGAGAGAGTRTVRGVIGGLHHGGCTESTSYSSPFDDATLDLYARATARRHPDRLPTPGPDGC
jgi:hypothetical protein